MILTLSAGAMVLRVTPQGGAIVDAAWRSIPILRPYPDAREDAVEVRRCASFPLVPFGNRIAGNAFTFEGAAYTLSPNTDWDRHYLHGDGWTSRWDVAERFDAGATFTLEHAGDVYSYTARQTFTVTDDGFAVELALTNAGSRAMPFGLGHHPFLPLTPRTTLQAPAREWVSEIADYMPGEIEPLPPRMDFSVPRKIPREWINNGFCRWSGRAVVAWPETGCQLTIEAPVERYFLFHSDTRFEPAFRDDYFCFEPMTHAADAHNRGGGLVRLEPGETTSLITRFTAAALDTRP